MDLESEEEQIDDKKRPKSSRTVSSLGQILSFYNHLDFDPPYQRKLVWPKSKQYSIMRSIFSDIPFNTIHFVNKDKNDSNSKFVLDGKQRLTTIKSFIENKFFIKFIINGKEEIVSWKNMNDPKHPAYKLLWNFNNYQIQLVEWPYMTVSLQRDVFVQINYSESLTGDEKRYCSDFLVKELLSLIFENTFSKIKEFCKSQIKNDKRFTGIRMIHQILIILSGKTFNASYDARTLTPSELSSSSNMLQKIFLENGLYIDDLIVNSNSDSSIKNQFNSIIDKIMEKIPDYQNLSSLLKDIECSCSWLKDALLYKNNLTKNKSLEVGLIIDFIVFFTNKKRDRILTNSYVSQNKELIYKFVLNWIKEKTTEDKRRSSTSEKNQRLKMNKMEDIFNKSGIDTGTKNNNASSSDKLLSTLEAAPVCPITGQALSNDTVQIDHKDPKSVCSTTKYAAISDIANNRKSDFTRETLEKTISYLYSE